MRQTFSNYLFASVAALFFILMGLPNTSLAESLQITHVDADRKLIYSNQDSVSIRYHINQPATVAIKIYDARDALVWQKESLGLPAGDHSVSWSATNNEGKTVPAEAYFFVIEATGADGIPVVHDLTDVTGGEAVTLQAISYDPERQVVKFTAPKRGRYFLRTGVSQAFMVNTLINNEVVDEGVHEVAWDGYDASHLFSVARHPKLLLSGFGLQLSDNALIVKSTQKDEFKGLNRESPPPSPQQVTLRKKTKVQRNDIAPDFYREVDRSRDVRLKLILPNKFKTNASGVPIISGLTPIRIELSPSDAEVMESQRGEVVFFWNNQLIYDNEISYYPYTFNWQPQVLDGKEHLITGFIAGFAGNVGVATIRVQLGDGAQETRN